MVRDRTTRERAAGVRVEPVPGEAAATATVEHGERTDDAPQRERLLLVADYHAGYEAALRYERGVDVPSRADERRDRLQTLVDRTDPDRLVVLGDLMHSIGDPGGAERGELEVLVESLPPTLAVTVVKGNHDGEIETWLGDDDSVGTEPRRDDPNADVPEVTVVPGNGIRIGGIGVCHGHTWPAPELLESGVEAICLGHEHPCVRLEDEVGGSRVERAWLRGRADPAAFADHERDAASRCGTDDATVPSTWLSEGVEPPRLIVMPAFNDLVGGTWVNLAEQSFLSPFLPDGLADGEAYLLDGTRLGPYDGI
ncbi:metallophosphoesterase [Halobiforma nitratireducens]|uniref:Metallophosphoesterase n=1 Tax=Halobiforma nitratireducens JCM 10879 TaxID=1227454 RepID=M0M1G3_9EURY|nr:metallophosphoesterase [Halobiforma nitratireducens]EMA39501.1 metallophosphoesterase [Halobiforma nitratireducens JCM 10879]